MAELAIVSACAQVVPIAWNVFTFIRDLGEASEEIEQVTNTVRDIERDLEITDNFLNERAENQVPHRFAEAERKHVESIKSSAANIQTTLQKIINKVYGDDDPKSTDLTRSKHSRGARFVLRRQNLARLQDQLQLDLTKLQTSLMLLQLLDASILRPAIIHSQEEIIGYLQGIETRLQDISRQVAKAENVQRNSMLRSRRPSLELVDTQLSETESETDTPICLGEKDLESLRQSTLEAEDVRSRLTMQTRDCDGREDMIGGLSPMLANNLVILMSNLIALQSGPGLEAIRMLMGQKLNGELPESAEEVAFVDTTNSASVLPSNSNYDVELTYDHELSLTVIEHVKGTADVTALEFLLNTAGVDVNIRDDNNDTALLIAVQRKLPQVVQVLLDHEADILKPFDEEYTILHHAVQSFHTALDDAAQSRAIECVQKLLAHVHAHRLVDQATSGGDAALHWAVRNGWTGQVKALLVGDTRANTNTLDSNDQTAFQLALDQKKKDCAKDIVDIILDYQPAQNLKRLSKRQKESLARHKARREEMHARLRSESVSLPELTRKTSRFSFSSSRRRSETAPPAPPKKRKTSWSRW